jgi:hypothetical protein
MEDRFDTDLVKDPFEGTSSYIKEEDYEYKALRNFF